jgi:hypothetical protein
VIFNSASVIVHIYQSQSVSNFTMLQQWEENKKYHVSREEVKEKKIDIDVPILVKI